MQYLSSEEARQIDDSLLTRFHYTIEQLIEAAGLCIFYKLEPLLNKSATILVICGPGNNGGDGMVLAKYLHNSGSKVSISVPWNLKSEHLRRLLDQCIAFGVPVVPIEEAMQKQYDVGIDAIYGFGFRAPLREDVAKILHYMMTKCRTVVSIDVPTGWIVDDSNKDPDRILNPNILVSMTAPKLCAKSIDPNCVHIIIKEFIPKSLFIDFSDPHDGQNETKGKGKDF